jgi:hypothetical protein
MWRGTDSRISLWRANESGIADPSRPVYGPFDGWIPIALTVGCDNFTYILWRNTDGSMGLWKLASDLSGWPQCCGNQVYAPQPGWLADGLSIDPITNNLRVLWRRTDGEISIWVVDSNLNLLSSNWVYGPYFGYDPGPPGAAAVKSSPKSSTFSKSSADEAADAAMRAQASLSKMPQ